MPYQKLTEHTIPQGAFYSVCRLGHHHEAREPGEEQLYAGKIDGVWVIICSQCKHLPRDIVRRFSSKWAWDYHTEGRFYGLIDDIWDGKRYYRNPTRGDEEFARLERRLRAGDLSTIQPYLRTKLRIGALSLLDLELAGYLEYPPAVELLANMGSEPLYLSEVHPHRDIPWHKTQHVIKYGGLENEELKHLALLFARRTVPYLETWGKEYLRYDPTEAVERWGKIIQTDPGALARRTIETVHAYLTGAPLEDRGRKLRSPKLREGLMKRLQATLSNFRDSMIHAIQDGDFDSSIAATRELVEAWDFIWSRAQGASMMLGALVGLITLARGPRPIVKLDGELEDQHAFTAGSIAGLITQGTKHLDPVGDASIEEAWQRKQLVDHLLFS